MENILPYKSLILATFYEKSKSKLAKKKDIWLLLQQHRAGQPLPVLVAGEVTGAAGWHFWQIMHIEVTALDLRQFFIIVEFCLHKVLDLKYPFVPSSV